MNALDKNKDTPLHHALKYGNENIIAFLLQEGADLEKKEKDAEDPLHLARTPKIARLLLDYGADPNAIDKDGNDVLTNLMSRTDTQDDVAKVLMDDCIATNGKEMDSRDLLVVYNLDFFMNGKGDTDKKNGEREQMNSEKEKPMKKRQGEFSKIKSMYKHESDLLYHPLSEAMIRLKWSKTRKWRHATNILKTIFAASFTFYVISDVHREHDTLLRIDQRQFGNESKNVAQGKTYANDPPERCLPFARFVSDYISSLLYFTAFVSALLLLVSEISQILGSTRHYFKVLKNVLELTMLSFAIINLLLVAFSFCEISYTELETRAITAISIFLAWVNIIFMLSGFSKVGIYIHMFMNVSRTLVFFVLIYLPVVIAFALSFRVLMPPEVKAFDRLWISFLKTMAMLVGELDYDGTFINNEDIKDVSNKEGLIVLTQIMSILFLCFGSIVIMNLLVGLTVSEIENLKSEARQVSLKQMFSELLSDQKIGTKGKKGTSPILDELLDTKTNERQTLKICVEPNARETENSVVQRSNVETDDATAEEETCETFHTWRHNCLKVIQRILQKLIWAKRMFIPKKCKVYFYDERHDQGDAQQKKDTGFEFSKAMVDNTVMYLKEKEIMRNDLEAQLNELDAQLIDDMEDVVSKHTDEILDVLRKR